MQRVTLSEVDVAEAVPGVHLAQLAAGDQMSIQYFHIGPGERVPEHSHPHEQVGVVVEGTVTFVLADGAEIVVCDGDTYSIPGGEAHAAENRGDVDVVGYDIFSPPRDAVPFADD
ncbi:MAG: cupin domain-containing protein [Halobacteriota archaeon]